MAAQHTHTELAAEVVGASLGQKATMAGAATGLVGWLAQVNWIGIAGVLIAALGLAANIYFQIRRDRREVAESTARIRRESAESTARIEALKERCEP